jgi:dihydrofolate synthase/folylpolyglutamate synthase
VTAAERRALERALRYADPLRGPGWNPRSPPDPRCNVPRVRALLDAAASPDLGMDCVLIAGTKGKGSTAAFLASVLDAAGIRTGLFTSPHLQSWRERIRIDGVAIGPRAFAAAIDGALAYVPALARSAPGLGEPSAFEILFLAAVRHFASERCRVAVLEVGLGGRFDATNAVEPAVSVVTPIGLDHAAILGPTLGAIAIEKGGIVRFGRPALLALQRPAAARALARACREAGADRRTVRPLPRSVRLGLAGDHQRQNAALARAAALELGGRGLPIDARAIARGLERLRWPGRFEVVRSSRADPRGRPPIVLDGAHTEESAKALAATLRRAFPRRRVHLVFGCTSDRDPVAIARPLLPLATTVHVTAASGPRAMPAPDVARALETTLRRDTADITQHRTVRTAIDVAGSRARPRDVVVGTGSLALVGEARAALGLGIPERLWS